MRKLVFILVVLASFQSMGQEYSFKFGVLKYKGGGDWYANPTSVPNLVEYCNKNLGMTIDPEVSAVNVGSPDIFDYPFIHMTGHGNVVFTSEDVENLRKYLTSGGFLHIDDNYGMDEFIRRELKKVFPETELVELPFDHPIYHQKYDFENGLPKVHEHSGKAPQGFAIIYEGRVVCFYTYECDLGDGWEDPGVHNDSEQARQRSLQMGANIVQYAMTGGV